MSKARVRLAGWALDGGVFELDWFDCAEEFALKVGRISKHGRVFQNNLVIAGFILAIAGTSKGRLAFISIICCKGKLILMFSTEIRAIVLFSGEKWRDGMERWRGGGMEVISK